MGVRPLEVRVPSSTMFGRLDQELGAALKREGIMGWQVETGNTPTTLRLTFTDESLVAESPKVIEARRIFDQVSADYKAHGVK